MTLRLLPLLLLLALALVLAVGLYHKPATEAMPASRMLGQPVAAFEIPALTGSGAFSPEMWKNNIVVLNVFASWCKPCAIEHPLLMKLSQGGMSLYGIAWKDKPAKVSAWLKERGNPYAAVGIDEKGVVTLPLALSGVPETLVVARGVVVYNRKSPLDEHAIQEILAVVAKHKERQ